MVAKREQKDSEYLPFLTTIAGATAARNFPMYAAERWRDMLLFFSGSQDLINVIRRSL
jgi:hypothetical protein